MPWQAGARERGEESIEGWAYTCAQNAWCTTENTSRVQGYGWGVEVHETNSETQVQDWAPRRFALAVMGHRSVLWAISQWIAAIGNPIKHLMFFYRTIPWRTKEDSIVELCQTMSCPDTNNWWNYHRDEAGCLSELGRDLFWCHNT